MEKKWSITTLASKHGTNSGISVFSNMEISTTTTRLTTRFSSLNNVHTIGNMTLITQFRGFNQLNVVKDTVYSVHEMHLNRRNNASFVHFSRLCKHKIIEFVQPYNFFFSRIVSCFIFPSLENVLKCINFRCYAKFKFTGEINIMVGIRRCLTCI